MPYGSGCSLNRYQTLFDRVTGMTLGKPHTLLA